MLLSEKFKKQIAAAELVNAYPCGVEKEAAEVVYKKAKKDFEKDLFKMIKDTYKNTMLQQQIKAFYIACFNDKEGGQAIKKPAFIFKKNYKNTCIFCAYLLYYSYRDKGGY